MEGLEGLGLFGHLWSDQMQNYPSSAETIGSPSLRHAHVSAEFGGD